MNLSDDGRSDESSDVELPEKDGDELAVNVNERRTRRGVYAVLKESDTESADDSEPEPESTTVGGGETPCPIDLMLEVEVTDDATSIGPNSLPPSRLSLVPPLPVLGLATPDPDSLSTASGSAPSRHQSIKPGEPSASASPAPSVARSATPVFEPIITTRRQKKQRELQQQQQQLVTPPL
jgi:histone-lysine N-methyltransferase SUV420H